MAEGAITPIELRVHKKFYEECPRGTDNQIFEIMAPMFNVSKRQLDRYVKKYKWVNIYRQQVKKDRKFKKELLKIDLPKVERPTIKPLGILPIKPVERPQTKEDKEFLKQVEHVMGWLVLALTREQIIEKIRAIQDQLKKSPEMLDIPEFYLWSAVDIKNTSIVDDLISKAKEQIVYNYRMKPKLEAAMYERRMEMLFTMLVSKQDYRGAMMATREKMKMMYLMYGTIDPRSIIDDDSGAQLTEEEIIESIKKMQAAAGENLVDIDVDKLGDLMKDE